MSAVRRISILMISISSLQATDWATVISMTQGFIRNAFLSLSLFLMKKPRAVDGHGRPVLPLKERQAIQAADSRIAMADSVASFAVWFFSQKSRS
jgi:hypothetical protein